MLQATLIYNSAVSWQIAFTLPRCLKPLLSIFLRCPGQPRCSKPLLSIIVRCPVQSRSIAFILLRCPKPRLSIILAPLLTRPWVEAGLSLAYGNFTENQHESRTSKQISNKTPWYLLQPLSDAPFASCNKAGFRVRLGF